MGNLFMKKFFVIFFFFVSLSYSQNQIIPVTLSRTEVLQLISKYNDVTYPIFVSLPSSYESTDQLYPVVYMLDAYSSFGIVSQMARLLAFDKELPEVIIVGISSKGGSKEFNYNRSRDYTPTSISTSDLPESLKLLVPTSGGAKNFLDFITNELIPFIEQKYRIKNNDRALIGHSLGGLFVAFALFEKPDFFNRYVMISPALFWDDNYLVKKEKAYYDKTKILNAIVYTSVGSLEEERFIEPWKEFIQSLQKHNYSGLKLTSEISSNETHYTIIPHIITHGLVNVFKY